MRTGCGVGSTPSDRRRPLRLALTIVAGALVALLFATGVIDRGPSTTGTTTLSPAQIVQRDDEGIATVVQRTFGSVVSLDVTTTAGDRGAGTGVIVDKSGLVVTNHHVVDGAAGIRATVGVRTSDVPRGATIVARPPAGSKSRVTVIRVRASVVVAGPARDLAIVKLPVATPTAIPLGDANELRLGQRVIAIGNALALTGAPTVTAGIVSGFRDLEPEDGVVLRHLIQTDAAINQGNSGGPLIDTKGRLVGINSLAASAGAAEDIGFAIDIGQARALIEQARQ